MKFLLAAALVAAASAEKEAEEVTSLKEISDHINKINPGWKADPHAMRFNSTDDVKMLCGTFQKDHPDYFRLPSIEDALGEEYQGPLPLESLPAEFDARTQWSACTVISKIRDQSACGSCWAFGSTEAFEDRQCVATGKNTAFSTEDTAACCTGFTCGGSQGCNGGQPSSALDWMTRSGVVTGGDFPDIGSGASCKPYTLAPCAHHVPPSAKYPACPTNEYPTPQCKKTCSESSYPKQYADDKVKGAKAFSLNGVQQIMSELVQNGPLSCAFTVYADFPTYKSGVYRHVSGQELGGHAVEIIGFGTESGQDYWLVKNSWNEQWGDGGTFKILRGSDECGIEDDVSGVSF